MNVTIDDSNSQIQYNGNWSIWRPSKMDPGVASYFRGTFHAVWNEGHWMNYTFNGTGAWVYGTYWLNHGAYSMSVDGGNETTLQGYTRDRKYNNMLYYTGDLPMGTHQLRMYNRPSRTTIFEQNKTLTNNDSRLWLDVDYIVVHLPVPEGSNVTTTVIDDTHPSITYSPEWSLRPDTQNGYSNTSVHQCNQAGASFGLPFTGTSIQLFGTIGPEFGNFSIAVDGKPYDYELNATWYERSTNSPLFFISGLDDTDHVLNLTNLGRGDAKLAFEFDYAVANTTTSGYTSGIAPDGSLDDPSGGRGGVRGGRAPASTGESRVGAIVGGVIGGLAMLALLALLFVCWRRKKHRRSGARGGGSGDSQHSGDEKLVHSQRPEIRIGSRAPGLSGHEVHPCTVVPGSPADSNMSGMAGAGSSGVGNGTLGSTHVSTATGYRNEKRGFESAYGGSNTSDSAASPTTPNLPFAIAMDRMPFNPNANRNVVDGGEDGGDTSPPDHLNSHTYLGRPLSAHTDALSVAHSASTGRLSTGTAENIAAAAETGTANDTATGTSQYQTARSRPTTIALGDVPPPGYEQTVSVGPSPTTPTTRR